VGDLSGRISDAPAAIKGEIKDYMQKSGEQIIDTLRRKAYENPLQAIALGAGVGYPLWRVFSNVPLPVLMVGAGIALARPGTKNDNGSRVTSRPGKASEMASDAAAKVASSVQGAAESVQASVGQAASSATEAAQASADQVSEVIDRYPLLVGAIGLGIGALIGAAIPSTRAETELVGELAGDVQGRAREMMTSGLEATQKAASDVLSSSGMSDKQGQGEGFDGRRK